MSYIYINYENIGNLKRKLEKIMEDFVSFENQLSPLQEVNGKLKYSLDVTLDNMIKVINILKDIINK